MQLYQNFSGWDVPKVILNIQLGWRSTNFFHYGLFSNKLENEQRTKYTNLVLLGEWGGKGEIHNGKNENTIPTNFSAFNKQFKAIL